MYEKFSPLLKGQPLAHIMRSIECYFRKKLKNSRFIVICEPYSNFVDGQKQASADYYQGRKFVIYHREDLPEKDLRVYIAHEVGHLFLLAELDISKKDKRQKMYTGTTEPLSSIFGVLAISEKSDFYDNYDVTDRSYETWQEILDSFIRLQNNR